MTRDRISLAVAIATASFCHAMPALSATLGEVSALSAIGEPFRAEIRVIDGRIGDAANCLRVAGPGANPEGLPWLAKGRISSVGSGTSARIVVTSPGVVSEPVLGLAIENVCGTRLRRTFTLLMPYPLAVPNASATPVPMAQPQTARPRRPTPAAAASGGRTWTTAAGESLASLAGALYPDDAAARRRFIGATAQANPALFQDDAARNRPLPAGTPLVVPDLRRLATPETGARHAATASAARPAEKTLPTKARSATQAPAPASVSREDRLVVADETKPASTGRNAGRLAREQEVAAAVDRSIVAEMELNARIRELQETQARLEARIRNLGIAPVAAASVDAGSAVAVATSQAAAVPPPAPAVEAEPKPGDRYLIAGLLLAALALAYLLLRRRPGPKRIALREPRAHAAPFPAHTTVMRGRSPGAATTTGARGTPGLLDWDPGFKQEPAHSLAFESDMDELEEHKSAIELAEIMVSFGRLHGAAETLAEFIGGNPRRALSPWLKLLEVYRTAGLRAEFNALARELNQTFNVQTVNWENYDDMRRAQTSVEQMPYIVENLVKLWRTPECQIYVEKLLRDNRNGTRIGFPFGVVDQLLTLSAILELEFGIFRPETLAAVADEPRKA